MDAYIIAASRTAVAKAKKGGFKNVRPDDLAAKVIKALVTKLHLASDQVDDVIVGNAVPEGEQGLQIARMVALLSLGIDSGGVTVNRYCGSGLEAIATASARIHSGQADCIIAGGTESMSMVPMSGYKLAPNPYLAKKHADYYLSMGLTAEEVAKEYGIKREEADAFSFQSHKKALKANAEGTFQNEIVPVEVEEVIFKGGKKTSKTYVVNKDEGPRADTSMEALSSLKPAFALNGTITAGNSSQTSDGAAFVVVVSKSFMKTMNFTPISRVVSYAVGGVEPRTMGIGPKVAIPKGLRYAGLSISDIDQIELNEAFAAQVLSVIKALDLDPEKINPNGGAISLGHPLGCTGAKLSVQLIHQMKKMNQKYGMVTACVGGGQGVAGIFENLS